MVEYYQKQKGEIYISVPDDVLPIVIAMRKFHKETHGGFEDFLKDSGMRELFKVVTENKEVYISHKPNSFLYNIESKN